MKVSEKQLALLIDVLQETLPLSFPRGGEPFKLNQDQRWKLWSGIMNQQSEMLVDVKGDEPKEVGR